MAMRRWIFLLAFGLLNGCDVAVATIVMSSQKESSDSEEPFTGFGGAVYQAWIASILVADAAAERDALALAGGNPSTSKWTLVGSGPGTSIFNPPEAPGSFNAILIQASVEENFNLDAVEVLDDFGTVLEHASGTTYSDSVTNPDNIQGAPDGVPAVTNASGNTRAFLFTLYNQPIYQFRINGQGVNQPVPPGNVVATGAFQSFISERPGGMAVHTNGMIHVTLSVGDTGRLARYDLGGGFLDDVEIAPDLATAGSHSVALNSAGKIFTACSVGAGLIEVRRFEETLSPGNSAPFSSGLNNDRVEHNGIAVDASGNIVIAGGFSSLTSGRNHWRAKIPDTVTGTPFWQISGSLDNSSITYWHAVTTGTGDEVFTSGDLLTNLFGGTNQVYSVRFNTGGVGTWENSIGDGQVPADVGHAVALDGSGNIYVGGSVGKSTGGKNGILVRYLALGGSFPSFLSQEFGGASGGDDEILDVAVDTDGSIYAVGYENVTSQGENWWVRKMTFNPLLNQFSTVWARTHHGGFGNDRAVSVAISGNRVAVAGFETNSSSLTKFVLRVYEK